MFTITARPEQQTASGTISLLSARLASATLLEDRRAAILGLRSFAKHYPATVASNCLRSLIGCLSKDQDDVETVKYVLETLLMLFNPSEESPESSEEIALWLADEFTQRQDNIVLLLDLVDSADFYSRLYSLQLLSSIHSARAERTEEALVAAPLGVSRLVARLEEDRDAIRNDAISFLTSITADSTDIQKLVAFEGALERIFSIIVSEGGLSEGGRVVEDSLILVANLVRRNSSNQALFRESGCIPRLTALLERLFQGDFTEADIASWALAQRNRNIFALLAVVRLFLGGSSSVSQSQVAFSRHEILHHTLQLAFDASTSDTIRVEALQSCADLIRGNKSLQESFAQLTVPTIMPQLLGVDQATGDVHGPDEKIFVIDALLDLTFGLEATHHFDLRFAACSCLKAYFYSHDEVRLHFLSRAVSGYRSGRDETANVLSVLLRASSPANINDSYRSWFACVVLFHLIYGFPRAKEMAMSVTEGDPESGEEVVTCIQVLAAHMLASTSSSPLHVTTGYLMLLLGWFFECREAVDDFLSEAGNLQSLAIAGASSSQLDGVGAGLCAMLLGVLYEFSTKDSPVPRNTLLSIITSRVGKDAYLDKMTQLRSHTLIRDFEVTPQKLPHVFFDATFVDFYRDNYSRILRSLNTEPDIEIPVAASGGREGVSRELVDSLRQQTSDQIKTISTLQSSLHRTEIEFDDTKRALGSERASRQALQVAHDSVKARAEVLQKQAEAEMERAQRRADAERADLKATISRLEVELLKAKKNLTERERELADKSQRLVKAETDNKTILEKKTAAEREMDDLLMVFGDLEKKNEKLKARLLALGGSDSASDSESEG